MTDKQTVLSLSVASCPGSYGIWPAGPAPYFAKLRSGKNQAKRPGSSFRADSLQPLCRLFGGRTCVMFARSTEARTRELRRLCPLVTDRTQEGDKPMAKTMASA